MLETLQNQLKITNTKLHAPIVTLATKYNVNLKKQLSNGFKRSFYCNIYQIIPAKEINQELYMYEFLLSFMPASLFAANAANNEAGIKDNRKYFLTKGEIKNYNVFIDGKNFMINQLMT